MIFGLCEALTLLLEEAFRREVWRSESVEASTDLYLPIIDAIAWSY